MSNVCPNDNSNRLSPLSFSLSSCTFNRQSAITIEYSVREHIHSTNTMLNIDKTRHVQLSRYMCQYWCKQEINVIQCKTNDPLFSAAYSIWMLFAIYNESWQLSLGLSLFNTIPGHVRCCSRMIDHRYQRCSIEYRHDVYVVVYHVWNSMTTCR
jgi:hypothetical protein